jgi:hypothetical protein
MNEEAGQLTVYRREPWRFEQVLGQEAAIAKLRRLVMRTDRTRGVILHGDDGLGKRTLAQVFAYAILCEDVQEQGEACGVCDTCAASRSGSYGITRLDGAKVGNDEDTFVQLTVVEPKSSTIAGRSVVILENADKIADRLFDRMLKTIEEPQSPATFMFLARRSEDLREAGQSRCVSCKLKPLNDISARRFVDEALGRGQRALDEERVNFIRAAGGGNPGQLFEALGVVAEAEAKGLCRDALLRELDLAWPQVIMKHWRLVLESDQAIERVLGRPVENGAKAFVEEQRRWAEPGRLFLAHVYGELQNPAQRHAAAHPALEFIDEEALESVLDLCRARFSEVPEGQDIWSRLMALAASDELTTPTEVVG